MFTRRCARMLAAATTIAALTAPPAFAVDVAGTSSEGGPSAPVAAQATGSTNDLGFLGLGAAGGATVVVAALLGAQRLGRPGGRAIRISSATDS